MPEKVIINNLIKWKRNCPKCKKDIFNTTKKLCRGFIIKNCLCKKCGTSKNAMKKTHCPDEIIVNGITMWKRKCPSCEKNIIYKNRGTCRNSIKKQKICTECVIKKITPLKKVQIPRFPKIFERSCPFCNSKIFHKNSNFCRESDRNKRQCKKCQSKKLSEQRIGKSFLERYGKERSKDIKNALSKIQKERFSKDSSTLFICPSFNKRGCLLFDSIKTCNIRHAQNGGEYKIHKYFVDGIDIKRKIIFEFDEKGHFKFGFQLRKCDISRMSDIINTIGFEDYRFIRYSEPENQFYIYKKIKENWKKRKIIIL